MSKKIRIPILILVFLTFVPLSTSVILADEIGNDTQIINNEGPIINDNEVIIFNDEGLIGIFDSDQLLNKSILARSEARYVVAEFYLSPQQVRDWAQGIRTAKSVIRYAGSGIVFVGKYFGGSGILLSSIAGLANKGPSYFGIISNAANNGRGLNVRITDYVNYHTSYSVQYSLSYA